MVKNVLDLPSYFQRISVAADLLRFPKETIISFTTA